MLTVGDKFPAFSLTAVTSADPKTAFSPQSVLPAPDLF